MQKVPSNEPEPHREEQVAYQAERLILEGLDACPLALHQSCRRGSDVPDGGGEEGIEHHGEHGL